MADDDALKVIRSWVGSADPPTDETLAADLERLGSAEAVALEILRGRRADLLSTPASISLPGDWSEDASANIRSLDGAIAELEDLVPSTSPEGVEQPIGVVQLVRLDRWRR